MNATKKYNPNIQQLHLDCCDSWKDSLLILKFFTSLGSTPFVVGFLSPYNSIF